MDDALELSLVDESTVLETTIHILDKMIYESFDPIFLHLEELKEILLTIYNNFWGSTINEFPYPYEDEELEGTIDKDLKKRIVSGKYNPTVNVPIKAIKTTPINDKFKEPIKIKIDDKEVHFRLPRVKDVLEAKKYIEKKYLSQEKKFSDIKQQIEEGEKIEKEVEDSFNDYEKQRGFDLIRIVQAQVLVKVFGKKLNTINEKIKYRNKVGVAFWKAYNKVSEDYSTFGINPEIKIKSPLNGKLVTRRFQFRYLDFLRALDIQNDNAYTVSFGE